MEIKNVSGIFVILFLLSIILLSPSSSMGDDPIRIGVTLGLTGKYSAMGGMQRDAYILWGDHINAEGGLLGRPVELLILDDRSDKKTAVNQYNKLMDEEKVDMIFGPYSSELTSAILHITAEHNYPVLACGAASETLWQQGYTNIFGVYTPAGRYTLGFLEMLTVSGVDKLAIVSADDPFSRSIAEGARKWADRFDRNILFTREFKKGRKELDDIAIKARESGAQVLLMAGHYDEAVNMKKAILRIGWKPKAYYASVGPALDKYREAFGADAQGSFSSSQWEYHPSLPYPGARLFYESFIDKFGFSPSYQATTAYACGTILGKAIERAGSLDKGKVGEILSTMDTMSPLGRYGVDHSGMQYRQFSLIVQWQDGKKEIVWPKELRTAEPLFQ
jgi:branched-chain amino acid transport system substrate-binding protein